jgi:phage-related protein
VDPESSTAITTQLANLAAKYIANNQLTALSNSITLDFVQLQGLTERVDLCDTVHIYFEALGITATAKCVAVEWDVLQERYTKCTFGDARTDITDKIAANTKQLEDTASRAYVNESSQLITGNLGGYVILNDSDGDGKPDEILIMNTDDPSTATQVWRFNKGGLGYGTSYAGPFDDIALTSDGKINASRIVTGTLTANVIKAGVLSDTQGNSTIDMTNGAANLKDLKAKQSFSLVDDTNRKRAEITYSATENGSFYVYNANGDKVVYLQENAHGGLLELYNNNNKSVATIQADANSNGRVRISNANGKQNAYLNCLSNGGNLSILNNSETLVAYIQANSANGASMGLTDSAGTINILFSGDSGNVRCVSLTQTSSRKVKENIKPIEDSAKILELDAVSFDYKEKTQGTDKRGFIAEDVAKVLPNLVTPETDDTPATLDYIGMIPYMQDVIKAQAAKIAELEERLTKLED